MEIQVTQEQVDAVIESVVRKELDSLEVYDDYYEGFLKKPLGEYLERKVKFIVEEYLKEKLDTIVDTEVAEAARMEAVAAFLDKPVTITDGYRKAEYESWSSYLLKRIHEHSLSDWNVNRMIRDEIDKRVNQLWKECESKARAVAVAAFSEGIESLFSKGEK
jgi:hypothetical protein